MIQTLLNHEIANYELVHVRMNFSSSMDKIGKINVQKILHIFSVVWRAYLARIRSGANTLYYVPGGSNRAPVLRDLVILTMIRPVFKKCIFHFHAAGVSEIVRQLPGLLKQWAKSIYSNADLAIFLSDRNPDNTYFKANKSVVIPNGLEDNGRGKAYKEARLDIQILFVGVLQETKGVNTLIEACHILKDRGLSFHLNLVGDWVSEQYKLDIKQLVYRYNLESDITFHGILVGEAKWDLYAAADIFCFPSYFESESFGNVLVEAMMHELPIIATNWRGIPDIVDDGINGYLVNIKDAGELSDRMAELMINEEMRESFGKNGREKYECNYKLEIFLQRMENSFNQAFEE